MTRHRKFSQFQSTSGLSNDRTLKQKIAFHLKKKNQGLLANLTRFTTKSAGYSSGLYC